jgi:MoaA/NifB/PqqE/SkfB family radical SAM enzyme
VDGLAPFNDRVRAFPGGFARVESVVKKLIAERGTNQQRPLIRINTVLMHDNLRSFPEFASEVASWGIDELSFNQLGGVERPEFHASQRLTIEDALWLADKLPALRRELGARGVRVLGGDDYLLRIRATAAGLALPVSDCAPGETFLFIDEDSRVSPCSFTTLDYAVPLSELSCAAELAQLPQRFRAAQALRSARACGDCHSTQRFAKFQAAGR